MENNILNIEDKVLADVIVIEPNTKINSLNSEASCPNLLDLLLTKEGEQGKMGQFIEGAKGHNLSFRYTDKYLKSQIGLIIMSQFVIKFMEACGIDNPQNFENVTFDSGSFNDSNCIGTRTLISDYEHDRLRDEALREYLPGIRIVSHTPKDMPHWRALEITDNDCHTRLTIMPDGGFANGWLVDTRRDATRNTTDDDVKSNIHLIAGHMPLAFHIGLKNLPE